MLIAPFAGIILIRLSGIISAFSGTPEFSEINNDAKIMGIVFVKTAGSKTNFWVATLNPVFSQCEVEQR